MMTVACARRSRRQLFVWIITILPLTLEQNHLKEKTMAGKSSSILLLLLCSLSLSAQALVVPNGVRASKVSAWAGRRQGIFMSATNASLELATAPDSESNKKVQLSSQIRKEGGLFAFNTKYGALNPYALYYGVTSVFLGLFWFVALLGCELLYTVTNGKVDKLKRLPSFFSQIWGEALMKVALVQPEVVGKDILDKFFER